ncbi:hypothetical protein AAHH80_34740, partial [Burkholderia pseudomallei]
MLIVIGMEYLRFVLFFFICELCVVVSALRFRFWVYSVFVGGGCRGVRSYVIYLGLIGLCAL